MSVRSQLSDLWWRFLRPTLAEAWEDGYQAGSQDQEHAYWALPDETPNPFRN